MSNIKKHRPYLYMGKTNSDYHIDIAIQVETRQTVSYSRSGKDITCTITTGRDTNTTLVFSTHRETIAIPTPDYGATETLNIIVVVDTSTISRDFRLGKFSDADILDSAPAGDEPLPHLLVKVLSSTPVQCEPSVIVLPTGNLLITEENLMRNATGDVGSAITVTTGTGNISNDNLVINNICIAAPMTGDYCQSEMVADGGKRKRVKIPQQGA